MTTVKVDAGDLVSEIGLASLCEGLGLDIVEAQADVTVVSIGQLDERSPRPGTVVIVDRLTGGSSFGHNVVVRRCDATPALLRRAVCAAANGRRLLPNGVTASADSPAVGLSDRQREVLELLAAGVSTADAADRLGFSERTVKQDILAITSAFGLNNRVHAVAWALRTGRIS